MAIKVLLSFSSPSARAGAWVSKPAPDERPDIDSSAPTNFFWVSSVLFFFNDDRRNLSTAFWASSSFVLVDYGSPPLSAIRFFLNTKQAVHMPIKMTAPALIRIIKTGVEMGVDSSEGGADAKETKACLACMSASSSSPVSVVAVKFCLTNYCYYIYYIFSSLASWLDWCWAIIFVLFMISSLSALRSSASSPS